MLAIAKSPRASTDREVVRFQPSGGDTYSRVAADVQRGEESARLQIDFRSVPTSPEGDDEEKAGHEGLSVQKYIRVNGVPRRASALVGQMNAVMFSADDMELVYGPPTVRRRYLDILISQLDHAYLRALQRYQRVLTQRNSLLRLIKDGRSRPDELGFWDDQLVGEGAHVMLQRRLTIRRLTELAEQVHGELTGNGEALSLVYSPNVAIGEDESFDKLTTSGSDRLTTSGKEGIASAFREAIASRRPREAAQGVTVSGPHRDDVRVLIDGMDAATYASRGQSRTAVLAMKLAEAEYLKTQRRQEPILLLDDVLSELDAARRAHVLERVSRYQQCFITTADVGVIEERFLSRMTRYVVRRGALEAVSSAIVKDPVLSELWDNEADSAYDKL